MVLNFNFLPLKIYYYMNGEIISKFRKIRHCSSHKCVSHLCMHICPAPFSMSFFLFQIINFYFSSIILWFPRLWILFIGCWKNCALFFLYFIFNNLMNGLQKNICVVWQDFWGDYLFLFITSPSPNFFIYFYYQSIKGML